ncbi:MAG: CinA family protein [Gammaproteobacteria bacterium]|nr:CinA family protein [Gammaproteobacteria bacterium]
MDTQLLHLSSRLGEMLEARAQSMVAAESCTGGLIAAVITECPGSSAWFDRGFVTYSNRAKTEMLGVPADLIRQFGAVSEPVVQGMVMGALRHSDVDYAVAVSGIAGPGGGSESKPVGTVFTGWGNSEQVVVQGHLFQGDRAGIRRQSVMRVLTGLIDFLMECA